LTTIRRAISIRQPYVEQILRGQKTWEYRRQNTKIRECVYLYASRTPGPKTEWRKLRMEPADLPTGRIIGAVEITATRRLRDGFAYKLENPRRLKRQLKPINQPQPWFWKPRFTLWKKSHDGEKIYECEVKKLFMRDGVKRWEWLRMSVADAIREGATEFRCKDCHGAVRLHGKHVAHAPAPHVEHKSRQDSEYCPSGMYFRQHPGREPGLSSAPVE